MATQERPEEPSPTTTLAGSVHSLQGEAQQKEQDVTHEGQVDDIEKQLHAAAPGPLASFAAAIVAHNPNPEDPAPASDPDPAPTSGGSAAIIARTRDGLITRWSPAPTWSTGKAYYTPIWILLVVLLFAAIVAFGIYSIYDVVKGGGKSETAVGP